MTRRRITAADVGLAPSARGRNLIGARRRCLACRRCGLIVEADTPDAERMQAWHTPGHPAQDCTGQPEKIDSKGEARTYIALAEAEDRGYIENLRRQVVFLIEINGVRIGRYTADFTFEHQGRGRVIDVKGWATDLAKFRRKVVQAVHGIEVEWWKPGETAL